MSTFSAENAKTFFDRKENNMNALMFLQFYFFLLIEVKSAKRYLIVTPFATAWDFALHQLPPSKNCTASTYLRACYFS